MNENQLTIKSKDMSCLSALPNQISTFLSVPHEVLLLRHRVFREYAKIAVGPDFIHTLPSFIVLFAMGILLWKNPPSFKWLPIATEKPIAYKIIQLASSWVVINGVLWLWLIFQRVIYCYIWSNWSNESENREITLPWWQKVWATFYPPPLEPPVLSAGFVSWIVSMILAVGTLGCAMAINRVGKIVDQSSRKVQEILESCNSHYDTMSKKFLDNIFTTEQVTELEDNSEVSSICDDRRSEISVEASNVRGKIQKRDIHPISYGTNWTPPPTFSYENTKEPRKKSSSQSLRTAVTVAGVLEPNEREINKFSPRLLRNRRGCHTAIPSYLSDKSSGC